MLLDNLTTESSGLTADFAAMMTELADAANSCSKDVDEDADMDTEHEGFVPAEDAAVVPQNSTAPDALRRTWPKYTTDLVAAALQETEARFDALYTLSTGPRIYPTGPLKEPLAVQVRFCVRNDTPDPLVVKTYGLPAAEDGYTGALNLHGWDEVHRKRVARELDILRTLQEGNCVMVPVHEKVLVNGGLVYMVRHNAHRKRGIAHVRLSPVLADHAEHARQGSDGLL